VEGSTGGPTNKNQQRKDAKARVAPVLLLNKVKGQFKMVTESIKRHWNSLFLFKKKILQKITFKYTFHTMGMGR
jgi:hypothetical protein